MGEIYKKPESIVHIEWSLLVVLKHRDTWLYMITSKRSKNTVNVLSEILKGLPQVSVLCSLGHCTL